MDRPLTYPPSLSSAIPIQGCKSLDSALPCENDPFHRCIVRVAVRSGWFGGPL